MILTKEQISEKKNKSMIVDLSMTDLALKSQKHFEKWDYFKTKENFGTNLSMGAAKFFLYEKITPLDKPKEQISHPKLGIFLDIYSCDQTIELEWIDHRRTWEYNTQYEYQFENNGISKTYKSLAADLRSELQYLVLWDDCMCVYGIWDTMPNWKQLRQAYERTWWYYRSQDEIRDIQINRLLS